MAIISVGSLWTASGTGYVYEVVALTPEILYSPIQTYTTQISDSRIFRRKPDDFLSNFTEGSLSAFVLTYLYQPLTYQGQTLTRMITNG